MMGDIFKPDIQKKGKGGKGKGGRGEEGRKTFHQHRRVVDHRVVVQVHYFASRFLFRSRFPPFPFVVEVHYFASRLP